ncbi:unnamed protein product [Closterium sp. Yama58-4]|nr:unnamed protein product [Closterium sp. Yama58-4]
MSFFRVSVLVLLLLSLSHFLKPVLARSAGWIDASKGSIDPRAVDVYAQQLQGGMPCVPYAYGEEDPIFVEDINCDPADDASIFKIGTGPTPSLNEKDNISQLLFQRRRLLGSSSCC